MTKIVYLCAILSLLFGGIANAAPPVRYGPPPAYQVQSPADVVREGVGKVIAYLGKQGTSNPARFLEFLRDDIAPYFDFTYMTRWAAGPRYRYMTAEQRADMEEQLSEMFLGAMAEKLARYRHSQVQFQRPRRGKRSGEVTVSVRAYQRGARPMQLDFRMYRGRKGWKVFDVSANGQSATVYYRNYFSRTRGQRTPYSY